jgi:hypothetical protein
MVADRRGLLADLATSIADAQGNIDNGRWSARRCRSYRDVLQRPGQKSPPPRAHMRG